MPWISGREQDRPEDCLAQSCSVRAWNRQGHGQGWGKPCTLIQLSQAQDIVQPSTLCVYIYIFHQDIFLSIQIPCSLVVPTEILRSTQHSELNTGKRLIVIWLFILNSLCTFFHQLKQNSLLSVPVLMFDMFCPFFTSYEQQCNPALPCSVPRYFKFPNSFPYTTAKAACRWGRMRKGRGQKNPFIESKLFRCYNKYCKWGTAILSSRNTMYGMETGKKKREKMHLTLMSRGKHYHRELSYTIC